MSRRNVLCQRPQSHQHVIDVQVQPVFGQPVIPRGHAEVLEYDHVPGRECAAIVPAVEVTAEGRGAVGRRAIQQERHRPFVELDLVVELQVVPQEFSHLRVLLFELDHQPVSAAQASAVADGRRPETDDGRELVLSGEPVVRFVRHERAARAERSGVRHFRDRRVHRPVHVGHFRHGRSRDSVFAFGSPEPH